MSRTIYLKFNYLSFTLLLLMICSCDKSKSTKDIPHSESKPDTNRFKIEVLAKGMIDPTEMAVCPNGDVLVLERKGKVNLYIQKTKEFIAIGEIKVNLGHEDGLLGIAIDPSFSITQWVYLLYTPDPHSVQRISRFTIKNKKLDIESEKIILSFPIVPERHQGGSLCFDKYGNLLISTGENTKPTDINGHAPIDERSGHEINDSQRSAGNTNDLRGKILRIHPTPDGKYTIPEGNLFAPNTPLTRPEIYVMGCRNPFRLAVDKQTNTLYWGDIGPDAGEDTEKGPKGHDEINRTDKAGNFGWPYFIANNKAYTKTDPLTNNVILTFDTLAPKNTSPNNTGLIDLPPAQKAWIWYPYDNSLEFPMMGIGGRTAIAGDIYHYNPQNLSGFPSYYDKYLFIGDWMRNFIKTVSQNNKGDIKEILPFLNHHKFTRPMDMQFGIDGCLYLLEYGTNWFDNTDAQLIRISYQRNNIAPIVDLKSNTIQGAAPMKVDFSSKGTFDIDNDELIYEWRFDNEKNIQSREKNPTFIYEKVGKYQSSLTVTDSHGNKTVKTIEINVGNTPPEISIQFPSHGTFFWPGDEVQYQINVKDKEDGIVNAKNISINTNTYFSGANTAQPYGEKLIQESDCKSCHQENSKSVGPSFVQISNRYAGTDDIGITQIGKKIVSGGSGIWGTYVMSAHPQLEIEEAKEMVKYILSLTEENHKKTRLASIGQFSIPQEAQNSNISFGLSVKASDNGFNGQSPITVSKVLMLKPAVLKAKNYDWCKDIINSGAYARMPFPTSAIAFFGLDLRNVNTMSITYNYDFYYPNCILEVREDSPQGKLIGKIELIKKKIENQDMITTLPITPSEGKHNLYFCYHPDLKIHSPLNLKAIQLNKK
ncbi:MAG: PKD domain-containing protein [Cytophagales bacterium]|nr:MAG: PKD domain-containing protein [Cytophagales bacterium]